MTDTAAAKPQTRGDAVRLDERHAVTSCTCSTSTEAACSVARTVSILSDPWAFLLIREAFFGARRFETFRSALGLPRGTLSTRLKMLTSRGIFEQLRYSNTTDRMEYRLTGAGLELYPCMIALMQYGDRWLAGAQGPPVVLLHTNCGAECKPIVACSCCREPVTVATVAVRAGPGAGHETVVGLRHARRSSDPAVYRQGRPSSVSRSLEIIGDRWACLIVREALAGVSRFDRLRTTLGIAPNILTQRLTRLVASGVLQRNCYQRQPRRFEYLPTAMGQDLYGPLLTMMAWGDRHLGDGQPPLLLHHLACDHDFTAVVVCNQCREPVTAQTVRYRMLYDTAAFEPGEVTGRKAPGRM